MTEEKGFTLIEVLIGLSLFSILSLIVINTPTRLYHKTLLKSTALEIKSALELSQNLSINESKEYCVEFISDEYRVREYVTRGRVVFSRSIDKNIFLHKGSQNRISYTRHGETQFGKFTLINIKGEKIDIDTLIGTGRVRVSDIYY